MRWRAMSNDVDRPAWADFTWPDCCKRSRIAWMFCFRDPVVVASPRAGVLLRHIWSSWVRETYSFKKKKRDWYNTSLCWHNLSVPLTTLWSELTALRASITFVMFWSREDFVATGRADSSWKWSLSRSSSANRKKESLSFTSEDKMCACRRSKHNVQTTRALGLKRPHFIGQSTCKPQLYTSLIRQHWAYNLFSASKNNTHSWACHQLQPTSICTCFMAVERRKQSFTLPQAASFRGVRRRSGGTHQSFPNRAVHFKTSVGVWHQTQLCGKHVTFWIA